MEVFIHREVKRNLVNTSLSTTHFSSCCFCLVAQLCLTPGTAAHQDSLSVAFPRQAYGGGLPFPSRGRSWPWDQTCVSCIAGGFFTVICWGSKHLSIIWPICSSLYSIHLMIHLKVNALACTSSFRLQ